MWDEWFISIVRNKFTHFKCYFNQCARKCFKSDRHINEYQILSLCGGEEEKRILLLSFFFSVFLSNLSVCRVAKKTLTNHHVISQQSAYAHRSSYIWSLYKIFSSSLPRRALRPLALWTRKDLVHKTTVVVDLYHCMTR